MIERTAIAAKSTGTVIVLIDSCRENPFSPDKMHELSRSVRALGSDATGTGGFALVQQGFATVKLRAGDGAARTFIGFATAPGEFAYDGTRDHSPFTAALLDHIPTRGLPFDQLFARVSLDVIDQARQNAQFQDPWSESNLHERFYLHPVSLLPVFALGLLGLVAGLLSCSLLFTKYATLADPNSNPLLWGIGLIFGATVGYAIRRWGSGHWRDVAVGAAGTAISFALALAVLTAPSWDPQEVMMEFNKLSFELQTTRQVVVLSIIASLLFVIGAILHSGPKRGLYRATAWIGAVILGLSTWLGTAFMQYFLSTASTLVGFVIMVPLIAGIVFTTGSALACISQRGTFRPPSAVATLWLALLVPVFFATFFITRGHVPGPLVSGVLVYALGGLWFAAVGAQLGYSFAHYVPEHRRLTPQ
jgi:hypothetical protein